jgi:hypothetical protein
MFRRVAPTTFARLRAVQVRYVVSSDAMDAAQRLIDPTAKHPATGAEAAANSADPRVLWREHWDLLERKPYYHNLITNVTSWDMPSGFPTRFARYYARLKEEADRVGIDTPEHARAKRVAEVSGSELPKRTLQDRLQDYGPSGVALYTIIHFVGFISAFALLWYGVDVGAVARKFGFDVSPTTGASKGTIFLGAVAINKVMVPFQILLTIALAPRLTPSMKYMWKRFVFYNQYPPKEFERSTNGLPVNIESF